MSSSRSDGAGGAWGPKYDFGARLGKITKPELETGKGKLDGFDQIQEARNDGEPFFHRTADLGNQVVPVPLPCSRRR